MPLRHQRCVSVGLTAAVAGTSVPYDEARGFDMLQLIAERATEGVGVPASSLESSIDAATIRNLQLEGLVEVVDVDDDLDARLAVTRAGCSVLHPQNSR